MNKICTSIEQSEKLIYLGIDENTADMYWWATSKRYYIAPMDDGDFNEITEGYIDTFVKEGSHNYLKIKIPMILCPTNCKKGDKVKLIIVKDK